MEGSVVVDAGPFALASGVGATGATHWSDWKAVCFGQRLTGCSRLKETFESSSVSQHSSNLTGSAGLHLCF